MYRFTQINVRGYKRLKDINLDMGPLMVMIGSNGTGKTSILEVFELLTASADKKLNKQLSKLGGLNDILTKDSADTLSVSIEMNTPERPPLRYELHLEKKAHSYAVKKEILSQKTEPENATPVNHILSQYDDIRYFEQEEGKLFRPTWDHSPFETSLSQVPQTFRLPEELKRTLQSSSLYHVLNVDTNSPVKSPQQLKPADNPGKNGEDLFSFLYGLRENYKERYELIIDYLKAAFPGFEELNFPPVAAGKLTMTLKEENFSSPLYSNQLSEGILRFIWLTSLLLNPNLPAITMIDEPEVSLHPELLRILVDLMREASKNTQLIVATHSDRLVRFLEPKEVVVMDRTEEGFAEAVRADTMEIDEWLKDYTLDEIWQMGRIGGRA